MHQQSVVSANATEGQPEYLQSPFTHRLRERMESLRLWRVKSLLAGEVSIQARNSATSSGCAAASSGLAWSGGRARHHPIQPCNHRIENAMHECQTLRPACQPQLARTAHCPDVSSIAKLPLGFLRLCPMKGPVPACGTDPQRGMKV